MSGRLGKVVSDYLLKNGSAGRAKLCAETGKSSATIDRWIKRGVRDSHKAYLLARACGVGEEEAEELALEASSAAMDVAS